MKIYTSTTLRRDYLQKIKDYDLGVMIPSTTNSRILRNSIIEIPEGTRCALDNGAFMSYTKHGLFDEYAFLYALNQCLDRKILLDFIVCPDILCGGIRSLDFSLRWADRLQCDKLALVVQDGMVPGDISSDILKRFTHMFIGGSPEWKWATAAVWVDLAHKNGLRLHIGQAGRLGFLRRAEELGADSVDSASFVRNNTFKILKEFRDPQQMELFDAQTDQYKL